VTDILYRIQEPLQGEFRDRGSRFFAFAFSVHSVEDIKSNLKELKLNHPDATHICYAYRLTGASGLEEYSTDAGEPAGSSGLPILNVLRRHQLVDTGIFVIRYYGGKKLGIPGLIHAYGVCTELCLENTNFRQWVKLDRMVIQYAYEYQRILETLFHQFDCKIIRQKFGEDISTEIQLKSADSALFSQQLSDKTRGLIHSEFIY